MINSFELVPFPKTRFGAGAANSLGELVRPYGGKVLLVTGNNSYSNSGFRTGIESSLKENSVAWERFIVSGEPSPSLIDNGAEQARRDSIEAIVAIGGGSVMDAGKAIAAMVCEVGGVKDFLEGVGTRLPSGKRLPLVALPTTAGTGSEATKNAVISETGPNGFKKSLRHDAFVPDLAVIDPLLTIECPDWITSTSGMDALTQLLESFLSNESGPFTDALALSGIERIGRSLEQVVTHPDDIDARTDMSYAAYLSGITLANAGLGLVHGFAQPLGSLFPIPHGIVCGTLMAEVNRVTVDKIREIDPENHVLRKLAAAGRAFIGDYGLSEGEAVDRFTAEMLALTDRLKIPKLSSFGLKRENFAAVIDQTGHKNHPVRLSAEELNAILAARY